LKGHDEVRTAPDPLVAAQMALLRVMHAADLPDPGELAKTLAERAAAAPPAAADNGERPAAPETAALDWATLVNRIDAGQPRLASVMRMQVRVAELAPGCLRFSRDPQFTEEIVPQLRDALLGLTGERWTVEELPSGEGLSLVEQEQAKKDAAAAELRAHPLVEAALAAFPDAELVEDGDGRTWNRRA
jgi:DNA polymerase-3 subunit gamma/tau